MISIKRDGTNVSVTIDVVIPFWNERQFTLNWSAGSEWGAGLLAKAMKDRLWEHMKATREEFYLKGYADAKAKRKKETYFNGTF